jgi:hypothetical protein
MTHDLSNRHEVRVCDAPLLYTQVRPRLRWASTIYKVAKPEWCAKINIFPTVSATEIFYVSFEFEKL